MIPRQKFSLSHIFFFDSNSNSNSTNKVESLGGEGNGKEHNQLMHDNEFLNDVEMENGHITNGSVVLKFCHTFL